METTLLMDVNRAAERSEPGRADMVGLILRCTFPADDNIL